MCRYRGKTVRGMRKVNGKTQNMLKVVNWKFVRLWVNRDIHFAFDWLVVAFHRGELTPIKAYAGCFNRSKSGMFYTTTRFCFQYIPFNLKERGSSS